MVTTRSKTTQAHIDDYTTKATTKDKKPQAKATQQSPPKANISRKRKSSESSTPTEEILTAKRAKPAKSLHSCKTEGADDSSKIIINRAPVLQLWSACVTQFLYPQLEWDTCLSAGSAISSICAVAKGRSIGTIPKKDESEAKQRKREETKKEMKELDVIEVMHFKLHLKDGRALMGSTDAKGKPGSENLLRKKFGEEEYEEVRKAFEKALQSWKGKEEELSKNAFAFYEEFRPDMKGGQKGWGRKGELSLERVESVVSS